LLVAQKHLNIGSLIILNPEYPDNASDLKQFA